MSRIYIENEYSEEINIEITLTREDDEATEIYSQNFQVPPQNRTKSRTIAPGRYILTVSLDDKSHTEEIYFESGRDIIVWISEELEIGIVPIIVD